MDAPYAPGSSIAQKVEDGVTHRDDLPKRAARHRHRAQYARQSHGKLHRVLKGRLLKSKEQRSEPMTATADSSFRSTEKMMERFAHEVKKTKIPRISPRKMP